MLVSVFKASLLKYYYCTTFCEYYPRFQNCLVHRLFLTHTPSTQTGESAVACVEPNTLLKYVKYVGSLYIKCVITYEV